MIASSYDFHTEMRQRRLAESVHALGPAPMLHLLREIEAGANLTATLERYAALPTDFIRQLGGNRFPAPFHIVSGDVA